MKKKLLVIGLAILMLSGCAQLQKLKQTMQSSRHLAAGRQAMKKGDKAKAIKHFDEAVKLRPNDLRTYQQIGYIYFSEKMWDKAAECFQKMISIEPKTRIYTLLGYCYQQAKRFELAEKYYRKAVELFPNDAEAYNALGYFYAERGMKLDESIRLIKKAIGLAPNRGHIIDSLGWAYYKKGMLKEALVELKRAVQLVPQFAEIWYHLGVVYNKLGQRAQAINCLQKSIKIEPDFKEAQKELRSLR